MGLKFDFSHEFQYDILRFICNDRDGVKAYKLIREEYFDLLPHSIIYKGISIVYNRLARIPGQTLLIEELNTVFKTREFKEALIPSDMDSILNMVKDLFRTAAQDGDIILQKTAQFASYVKMRDTIETVDLNNLDSYMEFSSKVNEALSITNTNSDDTGGLLLAEIRDRQVKRKTETSIFPTPFRQLNKLTNAGGYSKGSIIVILDKPKNLKTAMLINLARGYLRMKKNVMYIDMENGRDELLIRLEQSLAGVTKKEIIDGSQDTKVQKVLRRYKRLGGEIFVRRLPAFSTSYDIKREMSEVYKKYGFKADVLIVDYMGLMGSLSRKVDDKDRISDVYLDVANLALEEDITHVITAHHITREGEKREDTKYKDTDIAKCIDIVRSSQVIVGLNRNEAEKEANIVRLEIVAQRDGVPVGRALFIGDIEKQRIDEMTNMQQQAYNEQYRKAVANIEESGGDL